MEDKSPSDAALTLLLAEIAVADFSEAPCERCLRQWCRDWCDGHVPIAHPTKSVEQRQKEWECAHAWLMGAEEDIWILEIARMPRSGLAGRMIMDAAHAWRDHCARDELRAWQALYGEATARRLRR
jgi:hypothetical protein